MGSTLDDFTPNVTTTDTKKRLLAHVELVPFLRDTRNSLICDDLDTFIEGLVGWVNCSNYKVGQF